MPPMMAMTHLESPALFWPSYQNVLRLHTERERSKQALQQEKAVVKGKHKTNYLEATYRRSAAISSHSQR
jgi:hypothetical protein